MPFPSISILIDSYNAAPFLDEAIASARNQSSPVQQIVVADVSDDGSEAIVRRHAAEDSRVLPVFGPNRGQLATILAGLGAVEGDIVFLLDGDDRYGPDHLATIMPRWEQFPQADLIYCRHRLIGDEPVVRSLRRRQDHENAPWMGPIDLAKPYDWGFATALAWCLPSYHAGGVSSCLSFRSEHLQKLPLGALCEAFHGDLMANADYMILLASALYGGRKIYVPDRTVDYRVRPDSLTGRYGLGDAGGDYLQRYYCALARNWLCADRRFGPALRDILHKELAAVPAPSRGHRRLYAAARKASRGTPTLFSR